MRQTSGRCLAYIASVLAFAAVTGILICCGTVVDAAPVTPSQARTAVANWLSLDPQPLGAPMGGVVGEVQPQRDSQGRVLYHVAQLEPRGFVLLSGDDQIEPIICFSPTGDFDPSPENPLADIVCGDMAGRLEAIRAENILWWEKPTFLGIPGCPVAGVRAPRAAAPQRRTYAKWALLLGSAMPAGIAGPLSDERVAPLVQSKWSQQNAGGRACYNYYTPPNAAGDADNYPCGCVATAMAQLMRFHEYPTAGVGTKTFTIQVDGVQQSRSLRGGDGLGGPYQFSSMVLVPGSSTDVLERRAIGALCHDAGVSVGTHYSPDASSASLSDADKAMTGTFLFGSSVLGYNSGSNIGSGLNAMVNPNLDAGLPVLMSIRGATDGHAVVCDGYGYNASTLYHHLNMGWAGLDDAWYNLPNVDATSGGFSSVDQCLYNLFVTGAGEIISGRVMDNLNRPVSGAAVTAWRSGGGTYATTTNSRGIYALTRVPSNSTYAITVEKPYYTFSTQTVSTGRSTDYASISGNVWAVNFIGQYAPDTVPPTSTVTGPSRPTSASPITFNILFSEPVTGFAAEKLIVTGGSVAAFSGSGSNYYLEVVPSASGEVTCRVPAGAAWDAAGNPNLESNTAVVIYYDPPPVVTITLPTTEPSCFRNCPTLTIAGTATDNTGIVGVSWSNSAGGSGSCTGTTSWQASGIALAEGANTITVTATDTASNTGTATILVEYVPASPGDTWRGPAMVSLPIVPDSPDPATTGCLSGAWYAYDPGFGYAGYDDHRTWFEPASATPGRGFWAYFPPSGGLTPCGNIPPQTQPVTIHLRPGWNLIGQPFTSAITWDTSAITVRFAGGEPKPLRDSGDAVGRFAWGWDGEAASYYLVLDPSVAGGFESQLQPWQAYWVRAYTECDLVIPGPQ